MAVGFIVAGCTSPPPDDRMLQDIVVDATLEALSPSALGTAAIVVDSACLDPAFPKMADLLSERFRARGDRVAQLTLGCDDRRLPGTWSGEELERRNDSHVLLYVRVDGRSRRRTVKSGYTCGALCGAGVEVEVFWDGGAWKRDETKHVRY